MSLLQLGILIPVGHHLQVPFVKDDEQFEFGAILHHNDQATAGAGRCHLWYSGVDL